MAMSLKQEIETWVQALAHYDNNEFDEALKSFDAIADTSKILFNCGVIHATLGEHQKAVQCYQGAIKLDRYLAVAYFQEGVSNFLLGDFEEALANFNDALLYLRGNMAIDYEQLGLKFKLYSCEVLFNRGLCYIYLRQVNHGMLDLSYASKEKQTEDHSVIEEAIKEKAEGYTVFSIPVGVVYRPNEAKVKNLKTKDYLGRARLVAAADAREGGRLDPGQEGEKKYVIRDDLSLHGRMNEKASLGASDLVRSDLSIRTRQQSEPPVHRNMFPPTPPPEMDHPARRSPSTHSDAGSEQLKPKPLRTRTKPDMLDLGNGDKEKTSRPPKPRLGTIRTSSEPRLSSGYSRSKRWEPSPLEPVINENAFGPQIHLSEAYPGEQHISDPQEISNGSPHRRERKGERSRSRAHRERSENLMPTSGSISGEEIIEEVDHNLALTHERHRLSSRTRSRRPEVRQIRIKIHTAEDIRYVMIPVTAEFDELVQKIRQKFAFQRSFKIKILDEGDMITMGDQDDLDMAIATAREQAKVENASTARMEIWVHEFV